MTAPIVLRRGQERAGAAAIADGHAEVTDPAFAALPGGPPLTTMQRSPAPVRRA